MNINRNKISLLISVISFLAVIIALATQYLLDMKPCPWCILQRLTFTLIGIIALLAYFKPSKIINLCVSILSLTGIGLAAYQHFVATHSFSCRLSPAEKFINMTHLNEILPWVFEVKASCADAATTLLGLPYEIWSSGTFTLLAVLSIWMMKRKK